MNLKEIKQRILSVKSTQKITSAMKLVSTAKLRRAQNAIESMRPYQNKLNEMLLHFLHSTSSVSSSFTRQGDIKRVALVIVSSNTTLCGAFNANIIRKAKGVIDEYTSKGVVIELYPVGKKISEALRKMGYEMNLALCEQAASVSYDVVEKVASGFIERFSTGYFDRVEIIYTYFHSPAKLEPIRELYLPIENMPEEDNVDTNEYIVEPGKEDFAKKLLPKVIVLRLYASLLNSVASEHAARMMAMQIATDNADDLITELVREYNKGRQQAITNELLDIVAGSAN